MTVRPLADVVAALDGAFAAVPRPTGIDACSCCMWAEEIAVLLNTPRRRLQADDLAGYGVHVMNTVGGAEDLRYFTPRLLELALAPDGMTWPDMEVLCSLGGAQPSIAHRLHDLHRTVHLAQRRPGTHRRRSGHHRTHLRSDPGPTDRHPRPTAPHPLNHPGTT